MAEKKKTANKAEKKTTAKKAAPKKAANVGNRMKVEFTKDHEAGFKKGEKRMLQIRDARKLIDLGLAKEA